MKKMIINILLSSVVAFALNVGETPTEVTLFGENGSCVDGTAWNSNMLKGKVHLLLYVDPDKKEDNEAFIENLNAKKYKNSTFSSIAIINLKATWLPNFAIEKKLKEKQENFPNTLYLKDKTKHLVKEWDLADDSSNVIIFDKEGKVIYTHVGVIKDEEMKRVFALIEKQIQ
jgi:predicted transcriptional regulator